MAISSLLNYLGVALLCFAGVFFLIGRARTARHTTIVPAYKNKNQDNELLRARLVQRADWYCSGGLLAVALIAFAMSLIGSGPLFTRPSGNTAGAVLLIVALVTIILISALLVRYLSLSRALRDFDNKRAVQNP